MNLIFSLQDIGPDERERVGGKGFALAQMARRQMNVPSAVCVTAEAYGEYVASTGLRERILLELNRKDFKEMRWEEMWDASLRIRNMFLRTPIPPNLLTALRVPIEDEFSRKAVVVRSSAPGEDSARASFAGLHESYVNVRGVDAILEHIRLVWASLWSDAALLYRQELGLAVERSSMAVVVQEIAVGERSGVAFGKNPNDDSQAVVEAVYGLNQGLVDGTVEPDRWILDRRTGKTLSHRPSHRDKAMMPSTDGVRLEPLSPEKLNTPPLDADQLTQVWNLVLQAEDLFRNPQDVEWTFQGDVLYVIQSRPITTGVSGNPKDNRPWYLSLRRSFENLRDLRNQIENKLIPAMVEEAACLADQDLANLSDPELAKEIERRSAIHRKWVDVYWGEFIPFAHGARLFGQVYNDTMRPSDPYEFMDLLGATSMASLERNRMLEAMGSMIRNDPHLAKTLKDGQRLPDSPFSKALSAFLERFGDLFQGGGQAAPPRDPIIKLLLEMATRRATPPSVPSKDLETLRTRFLSHFDGDQRTEAAELLDLGRASYRLRDDDNIHLGRIENQLLAALKEGRRRIEERTGTATDHLPAEEVMQALKDRHHTPSIKSGPETTVAHHRMQARQLVGQPAGPGIARGRARVVAGPSDLFDFKAGEILVCDAVDPNMTFVVPLSAGIVERRGGMLIHGAIIAREYGLPCVTGVPDASSLIRTGDHLTVDGYLGIVIIGKTADRILDSS